MKDRFKIYGYEITTDPEFQNDRYGVMPELAAQFETLLKSGGITLVLVAAGKNIKNVA